MKKRKRELMARYSMSSFDIFVYEFFKILLGMDRAYRYISKISKWKYGKKDNLSRFCVEYYYHVAVGKYTYGWEQLKHHSIYLESIGSFCSIAFDVNIAEGTHPISYVTTSPIAYDPAFGMAKTYNKDVLALTHKAIIGNDVWIGRNAVILSGVKIGNGAIIGAGAVVIKDVPDYAIVGGVPAKIIRYRFTPEIIETLNKIKWWEWSDEKIISNLNLLSNPEKFIEKFKDSL